MVVCGHHANGINAEWQQFEQQQLMSDIACLSPTQTVAAEEGPRWNPTTAWSQAADTPAAVKQLLSLMRLLLLSADRLPQRAEEVLQIQRDDFLQHLQHAFPLQERQSLHRSSQNVATLQAGVLLVKLVVLASSVSDGQNNKKAVQGLWAAIWSAGRNLKPRTKNSEAEEEAFLCHLITPMLLSAIKEDTKQDGRNVFICYDWLLTITSKPNSVNRSVMSELVQPGEHNFACVLCSAHRLRDWPCSTWVGKLIFDKHVFINPGKCAAALAYVADQTWHV